MNIFQKFTLLYLLLILVQNSFAQQQRDSIIYLEEVTVSRPSNIVMKTNGKAKEVVGFYENEKFVSLVKNIPVSQLNSITFYFDAKVFKKEAEYEFELLILEQDKNGKPGNALVDKTILFRIQGDKKEKITLDLSDINIYYRPELFIGFKTINLSGGSIVTKMAKNTDAVSFYANDATEWSTPVRAFPIELQLEVNLRL